MELPRDVMNHIKTFLPPHPLQNEISRWKMSNLHSKYKQSFHKWYFWSLHGKKERKNETIY